MIFSRKAHTRTTFRGISKKRELYIHSHIDACIHLVDELSGAFVLHRKLSELGACITHAEFPHTFPYMCVHQQAFYS